jgi:predicted PurR-regulated permease PerM
MNELIDFLSLNTTVAYLTALAIFVLTVILLFRRIIGFMITLLLLAFALVSGFAIANYDLFREIVLSFKYDPALTKEDQYTHYITQLNRAFQELKEEFQEKKLKWEAMYETYKSLPDRKDLPKEETTA